MYALCTCTFECTHIKHVCDVPAVRYNYYQYGDRQGDVGLRSNLGYGCYDWSRRSCASDFIQIPKVQIFNGRYRRMKVTDSTHFINAFHLAVCICYLSYWKQAGAPCMDTFYVLSARDVVVLI